GPAGEDHGVNVRSCDPGADDRLDRVAIVGDDLALAHDVTRLRQPGDRALAALVAREIARVADRDDHAACAARVGPMLRDRARPMRRPVMVMMLVAHVGALVASFVVARPATRRAAPSGSKWPNVSGWTR